MKILKYISLIIAGLGFATAYASPPETKTVTLPFEVNMLGIHVAVYPDDACSPLPGAAAIRVIVQAHGTGIHLGNMQGDFSFCFDPATGDYGYGPTSTTTLTAANGDKLYFYAPGRVKPREEGDPPYVTSYWRDQYFITGGTGRFEGATGICWTDDYNSTEDAYSHHHWVGWITLVVGKR